MDIKLVKDPRNMPEPEMDAKAIPDLDRLLATVLEFLEYIGTPEMQAMEIHDNIGFEHHMDAKYPDLSLRYYSIFKLLLDREHREENVCKLIDIFSALKRVKSGEVDIKDATSDFQEGMNNEYIYPKFGGKEKFEKKMASDAKKGKKKPKKGT